MGVAPPAAAAPPVAAKPAPLATAPAPTSRDSLPSDFPMALGSLDEVDLPLVSADLPAPKKAPPAPPTPKPAPPRAPPAAPSVRKPAPDDELDLPVAAGDLPTAKRAGRGAVFELDLPTPAADLPAPKPAAKPAPPRRDNPAAALSDLPMPAAVAQAASVGLPVVAAGLPSPVASLPVVAAHLPSPAASLPMPGASLPVHLDSLPSSGHSRGFGEIDLPTERQSVSSMPPAAPQLGSFGEIDLPREVPPSRPPERIGSSFPPPEAVDFGDLQLDDKPRTSAPGARSDPPLSRPGPAPASPPVSRGDAPRAEGGMSFGEVDLGAGHAGPGAEASMGVEGGAHGVEASLPPPAMDAATAAQARHAATSEEEADAGLPKKRSMVKVAAIGLLFVALLAGGALEVTPCGAFGRVFILDLVHAGDYAQATSAALAETEKALGSDIYPAAKAATDSVASAHGRTPRARALGAYAALVEYAVTARFGPDDSRPARARAWLAELPANPPVAYADVASAARAAAEGDVDEARKSLDAAARRDPNGPIQVEVALLRGGVELRAGDGAAAVAAFQRAVQLANDARGHFGLARAYDLLGDEANVKKEIYATLSVSHDHPGALTLRARHRSGPVDPTKALADLALVLEGPARANASPDELSSAYAARGWTDLQNGKSSNARDAFAQASQVGPHNADALRGAGRLLLNEGRYTEALARFDTALQSEPNSPEAIADDAEAKIALERLADAKQQLLQAREKFPKNVLVMVLLARAEQHLGNNDAAESDLRAAIAMEDPSRPEAVIPYVALSELQSSRGRLSDARATLDAAKGKLPGSAALERALGEVSETQGEYDAAIGHYRAALLKDPKDVAAHFHLGSALRRVRRFDEAATELDKVAAVDRDYPGLSLERGLLFEESGDVEKAIELFKSALAKAPDDPDLQLRVGSAYVAIGRPDDALPMLHKVLDKRPTSAEAHHYIGRALMLKGGSAQGDAIHYLKRAVDLDPNRSEFHVYLAWAADDATPAQLELARDEIDKALALDKLNPEAYWQRGVLERMEGAIDDAVKDEKHALELRPSRFEAHATLAECYEDKNDDSAATGEWAKAIAGEGPTPAAGSPVPHPYWRFRYGKLLFEHGGHAAALPALLAAATTAEGFDVRPAWLAPLEFLTAEALRAAGKKAEAIEHYRRFLELAPVNSPDKADAQRALTQLTGNR